MTRHDYYGQIPAGTASGWAALAVKQQQAHGSAARLCCKARALVVLHSWAVQIKPE